MASLSYDSSALLRNFAERKRITYPALSDPESKVIRSFDIFNDNYQPGQLPYGVPYPGLFLIDQHGIVRAKYFEEDHGERYTAASILIRQFGGGSGATRTEVETKHLKVISSASDSTVSPGNRLALMLEVDLKPGMHVYAPGVEGGYIPIEWTVGQSKAWLAHPITYPASRKLHLPAIQETVPVYQGRFRIERDLTIAQNPDLKPLLSPNRGLTVEGSFRYQACDDQQCFVPQTVPLKWTFHVEPLDSQRAPSALQRPSK